MRPLSIEPDRLVFAGILNKGVPTLPSKMRKIAERIAAHVGCSIIESGGCKRPDAIWQKPLTWFVFNRELTEDEVIELEEFVEKEIPDEA